jgi:hypothetical protein
LRDCSFAPTSNPAPFPFHEDELPPPEASEDLEPDEESFREASDNEGATFERIYRRAALVLRPSENFLSVVAGPDMNDALAYLEALVERATSIEDRASTRGIWRYWSARLRKRGYLNRPPGMD